MATDRPPPSEIVAADIGGTHARFAIARPGGSDGVALDQIVTLKTADYAGLDEAWRAFGKAIGRPLPAEAAIAVAAPIMGEEISFTNGDWTIRPHELQARLKLERLAVINDFVAVARAVTVLNGRHFRHLCGPDRPIDRDSSITVLGPGTGLGAAQILRADGTARILATEGGHIAFAPLDEIEDALLIRLREKHGRVSVERVVAGQGLAEIHAGLSERAGARPPARSEAALWHLALAGEDALAIAALDRFCACLGSVAGDLVLAHGASAAVVAGGLGLRLSEKLPSSSFPSRFIDKGRFLENMSQIPVKLLVHDQPGLLGAAVHLAEG